MTNVNCVHDSTMFVNLLELQNIYPDFFYGGEDRPDYEHIFLEVFDICSDIKRHILTVYFFKKIEEILKKL